MAISPQRLTIYLYSAHRAVIFAIAQLSCTVLKLLLFQLCDLIKRSIVITVENISAITTTTTVMTTTATDLMTTTLTMMTTMTPPTTTAKPIVDDDDSGNFPLYMFIFWHNSVCHL